MSSPIWATGYQAGQEDYYGDPPAHFNPEGGYQRTWGQAVSPEHQATYDEFHAGYLRGYYNAHQEHPEVEEPEVMYEDGTVETPTDHHRRVFQEGLDHRVNPLGHHPPHNPAGVGQDSIEVE